MFLRLEPARAGRLTLAELHWLCRAEVERRTPPVTYKNLRPRDKQSWMAEIWDCESRKRRPARA